MLTCLVRPLTLGICQTTCRWINLYAQDQANFFADFKDAYIKLVNTGASWRSA